MSETKMEPYARATKIWVLALASVASLMAALDAMVVTTALGTIRIDLGASMEALQWTVNAYTLTFAVLLLTGAALGDRLGRRRMFAAGLGLFVAASVACALATNVGWLIAARAGQGAGAALLMPLAMAVLSAVFPPQERGKALGIFSGVTGVALIAGPAVGGAVAEGLAWQWIFWINVPIGLIAIPLVLSRVPESFGPAARLDLRGLVLVTGAALARCRAGRCVCRLGTACQRADGADAAFLCARFRVWHRGKLSILRLDVWRCVLPAAILSDGARIWSLRLRIAIAAMDGDLVRVRTDRWQPRQSARRATAGRDRLGDAGGRILLDQPDRHAWCCLRQSRPAADPGRCRRVDGDARRSKRRFERRRNKRGRKGVRHFQHVALSRRDIRCRARRCRLRGDRKRRLGAGFQ
jgi:MFS family permease